LNPSSPASFATRNTLQSVADGAELIEARLSVQKRVKRHYCCSARKRSFRLAKNSIPYATPDCNALTAVIVTARGRLIPVVNWVWSCPESWWRPNPGATVVIALMLPE